MIAEMAPKENGSKKYFMVEIGIQIFVSADITYRAIIV